MKLWTKEQQIEEEKRRPESQRLERITDIAELSKPKLNIVASTNQNSGEPENFN